MSEQAPPQPRFIVVRSYNIHRIAMLDERGVYRMLAQMQQPYDHYEAALKLCEALTVLDIEFLPDPDAKPYSGTGPS
jgi:hypothetical protein